MTPPQPTWTTSLRQSVRLLPEPSPSLRIFLESEGRTRDEVLALLPYEAARAGGTGTGTPDPKRYRDNRQVYRSIGLVFEEDRRIRVTPLGKATLWWLDHLTPENVAVLAQYAAYALSAWQLPNPTPEGRRYPESVRLFPYSVIWRVMLMADGRINSEEIARVVLRITNDSEVDDAVERIMAARESGRVEDLGSRVEDDNDRIIPWMALASFGWTLFSDKSDGSEGYYTIPNRTLRIVERAAAIKRPHLEFDDEAQYFEHISRAAALPPDLRCL